MSNFYTDVIMKSPLFRSANECRSLDMLEPVTRAAVVAILAECAAVGSPLMVTETYRSVQRQEQLYEDGATELKTVGVHHYGLACDFAKVINGKPSWGGSWTFLRDLAVKHGLVSGVDWGEPSVHHSFIDPDHVQRCTLAEQDALFAGTWYPS